MYKIINANDSTVLFYLVLWFLFQVSIKSVHEYSVFQGFQKVYNFIMRAFSDYFQMITNMTDLGATLW